MAETVFFYIFTGLMLAAALLVVFSRQPVYSVLSLLVVMFCLASLFVLLGAYFMAALQILLYAGAVLVLFLFVIMLLNLEPEAIRRMRLSTRPLIGTAAAFVLFMLFWRIVQTSRGSSFATAAPASTVESIGKILFSPESRYMLPFELTSFIILAAIIGAVTLAKQESKK